MSLRQILQRAVTLQRETLALATLVRTRGSTYRKVGTRMLIEPSGRAQGVLSGGCLEEQISRRGLEVIRTGHPELLEFDTRRLFGCAGFLEILVEPITPVIGAGSFLTDLAQALARRERCQVQTRFEGDDLGSMLLARSALIEARQGVLIDEIALPTRLLVIGAGPELLPLRAFCATLDWELQALEHPSELPATLIADSQTAAIVMTHNFGQDLAALNRLLPLGLPYVGLLGPRRRQAELLTHLQESAPFPMVCLDALYSPAGLDIGSESPEEIALAIVAEITAVLAQRRGGFLRERPASIHATVHLASAA